MIRLKSEALQPGMVVARDEKNLGGMPLAPSGCELSVNSINKLPRTPKQRPPTASARSARRIFSSRPRETAHGSFSNPACTKCRSKENAFEIPRSEERRVGKEC